MKVLLLGATGRTGKLILEQLLTRDHQVNVLVRDKAKIKKTSDSITIFEGSTLISSDVNKALKSCQCVISALNISRRSDFPWSALRTPTNFLSKSLENVIQNAHIYHINRLITITAWGVNETKKDIPWWFRWVIDHSNIRYAYADHELQEELLKQTTFNYTVIRPAGLTNFGFKPVNVWLDNLCKPSSIFISRKSVAKFTVDILEQELYISQMPVITN